MPTISGFFLFFLHSIGAPWSLIIGSRCKNNLQEFLKKALSCNIRVPYIKISGESMDISGKVALITGGASGLGLATAEKLLAAGSKIMLVDLNEDNAKKAAENLGGWNGICYC